MLPSTQRTFAAIALILLSITRANSAPNDQPKYLERVHNALQEARSDVSAMQAPAEEASQRLIDGGRLFAAGQPSMISEVSGRAGGFIMLEAWHDQPLTTNDVVLFFDDSTSAFPEPLRNAPALVMCFGTKDVAGAAITFNNHTTNNAISPTLANAIPAWVLLGEIFAASTRLGKTPAMYESIGMYGAQGRNGALQNTASPFHTDVVVPPIAPGVLGTAYIDNVSQILTRVNSEESSVLNRTALWAADAARSGKRLFMFSMGHLFPDEVGSTRIGEMFQSQVYNAGFREQQLPSESFAPGDLLVHIGYQHPPSELITKARSEGARVSYVSLYAERNYAADIDALWIDPMWRWPDGCVTVPGYEVPILPSSGLVNGAIAWEIYSRAKDLLGQAE